MIEFERNRQQTIPESSVKIIGLGGAGANMLDRIALDGIEGAELMALNTDMRTLKSSVAGEKIQLGRNLTKGLGAGGDPEIGEQAVLESEEEVRDALRNRKIVFLCVGLGGGTGSGAAPIVTRLAREAGAFIVVFATMPFAFEGKRRRIQAEESLNQLAVLTNALVTFDNGRMGELVLPKQGVHEAFSAADRMISDSITAVARLVLRPGLINVGLDELMSALDTTRSRCLFGSGLSRGENRAQAALKSALASPLLDRGSLLKDATTVLVHICGGEDMTLYEVELLMQGLTKFIPEEAHLLFGAASDPSMKEALSVTIISALPEDRLKIEPVSTTVAPVADKEPEKENISPEEQDQDEKTDELLAEDPLPENELENEPEEEDDEQENEEPPEEVEEDELLGLEGELEDESNDLEDPEEELEEEEEPSSDEDESHLEDEPSSEQDSEEIEETETVEEESDPKDLNTDQVELELDGGPKGRFEGTSPNLLDGEDLDVPPYLRKKRR